MQMETLIQNYTSPFTYTLFNVVLEINCYFLKNKLHIYIYIYMCNHTFACICTHICALVQTYIHKDIHI